MNYNLSFVLPGALWSVPARTFDIPSGLVEVGTLLEYTFLQRGDSERQFNSNAQLEGPFTDQAVIAVLVA